MEDPLRDHEDGHKRAERIIAKVLLWAIMAAALTMLAVIVSLWANWKYL
jgi:hypothetical protein